MSRDRERRVLVVGYGNTVRSDDGIGWRAAEALLKSGVPSAATVLTLHQLDAELAGEAAAADVVLFVDAARDGEPGEVRWSRVAAEPSSVLFSHQLSPSALMAIVRTLYPGSPEAFEVTMTGVSFEVGENLSPVCEAALPHLVEVLAELISHTPPG